MDLKNGMVIRCNSEEEAKEFIKEAYKQGFKWANLIYGIDKTYWYTGCFEKYYHLKDNRITWSTMYSGNDSIEYSTLKEKIKTMTKSDLKNGMVVELRNGKRFLIVNNFGIGKDSCINLDGFLGYDENLYVVIGVSTFDITKIYKTVGHTFKTLFDNESLSLIWEREETKLSNEDKQIIKKGLKILNQNCKQYVKCDNCELYAKGGYCVLEETPENIDVDKLFED